MTTQSNPPLVWPTSDSLPLWTGIETAETWFAAISSLDDAGVTAIQAWLRSPGAKSAQLVVLVYAACATTKSVLSRLLRVAEAADGRLECAVLGTGHYHPDANGTAALLQVPGRRSPQLWTSNTSNFDLIVAPDGRLNVLIDAEATLVGRWTKWFSKLWERSAPLTLSTANIPALVPAQGTEEGARMWDAYQNMCAELGLPPQAETAEDCAAAEERIEEKAKELCGKMNVAAPDPVAERVCDLYKAGVLVTIDKAGVVPPLHIPVKAKWLGVESERQFGKGRRKVDFKIQLFEEGAAKKIDGLRKSLPRLLDWYSFRLADDHRWVPFSAIPLIEKEMTRIEQEARKYVQEQIGGGASEYAKSRRKEMESILNEMSQEFHPGRQVGPEVMDDMIREAERRLNEAMRERFLPRISQTAVSFLPPADPSGSSHSDSWAQARTLLDSIAQYFRGAVSDRFFFQGYTLPEDELLKAMNVADDWVANDPWAPATRNRAKDELDHLAAVLSDKATDREKCELILNTIDGKWTPPPQFFLKSSAHS